MIEVAPGLFVGNAIDYEKHVYDHRLDGPKSGWSVVHAAKEPYHRAALGYTGRGAPKDHPEYLFAFRENRLCLNLVDVPNVEYINNAVIDAGLNFIREELARGQKLLCHCNQGQSRGPALALLHLSYHDPRYRGLDVEKAAELFRETYPQYDPADGIGGYLEANWPWKEAA